MPALNLNSSGPFPYDLLKERFPDLLLTLLGEPVSPNAREWRWGKNENFSAVVSGDKAGSWFDHKADQGGGPIELIQQQKSMDHEQAVEWARDWLGSDIGHVVPFPGPAISNGTKQDTIEKARRLWTGSIPIAGTEGETYFRGRGITKALETVRFLPQFWYETKKSLPAIIIRATSGAVQVTVIRDGKKAPIQRPKRSYGPISGSWVQIQEGAGPALIGEGLENVLSAICAGFNGPALVSLGISNLAKCATSCPYDTLLLLGDGNAVDSPARDGFVKALATASRSGKTVRPIDLAPGGGDLNEILRDAGRGAVEVSRLVSQAQAGEPWRTAGTDPAAGSESPATQPVEYEERDGCLYWNTTTRDGLRISRQMANFTARIVAQVEQRDGVDVRKAYEICVTHRGASRSFRVPAQEFGAMNWTAVHLSATATVNPGQSTKERAAHAIRLLSGEIPERQVFSLTGWTDIDKQRAYLSHGGAIGADGRIAGVEVELPEGLQQYCLPDPPQDQDLIDAVRASLSILEVASDDITAPLLGSTYRAVLGESRYTLWLSGGSGAGKTTLAVLAQQHWGRGFSEKTIGSWSSTANSIEEDAFIVKDAVFTVDDYAPAPSRHEAEKLESSATRVLRSQGNRSGRGSLKADRTRRASHPPRGMVLSTGEHTPNGNSALGRTLIIEVPKGTFNFRNCPALDACQSAGRRGLFAQALAGFVRWLAGRFDETCGSVETREAAAMKLFYAGDQHSRCAPNLASAFVGFETFIRFAQEVAAVTATEADKLISRCTMALVKTAAGQAQHNRESDLALRYLRHLASMIKTGRAHLASMSNDEPPGSDSLGWRPIPGTGFESDNPEKDRPPTMQAGGLRVGWIDGENVYLDPETAFQAADESARREGAPFSVGSSTMKKRLHDKGYLASTEQHVKNRATLTVRRTVSGARTDVLHLKRSVLFGSDDPQGEDPKLDQTPGKVDQSAHIGQSLTENLTTPEPAMEADPQGIGHKGQVFAQGIERAAGNLDAVGGLPVAGATRLKAGDVCPRCQRWELFKPAGAILRCKCSMDVEQGVAR